MVEAERSRAPVLLLDAGNALFKHARAEAGGPSARPRAELLLAQMDALGTAAMAVGHRDLSLGLGFLREAGGALKRLRLLSANLVGPDGKRPFAPSAVLEVGGLRFGVVGVSPAGAPPGDSGLTGQPPVPAAVTEAKRLREQEKVDVVVVLAALPHPQAMELTQAVGSAADLVVQSHDGRGPGMAQQVAHATLVPPGERGRQLGRLELSVAGPPAPFVDLGEKARAAQAAQLLDSNIQRVKERLASTQDPGSRRALEEALVTFQGRRQAVERTLRAGGAQGGRTLQLTYINLGPEVAGDPTLRAAVERIEPPGSAHEH